LRNKLPQDELPQSLRCRLKRIHQSIEFLIPVDCINNKDLDSLHYYLDFEPPIKRKRTIAWVYICALAEFVDGLRLCLEYDCCVDLDSLKITLQKDNVEMSQMLLESIFEELGAWDYNMIANITLPDAVQTRTSKCLKYLYSILPKRNHPNRVWYTMKTAQHGNIEGLKFLCDNGCPINIEATRAALDGGSVECFKYASEQQPLHVTKDDMIKTLWRNHYTLFKHLHSIGNGMFIEFWNAVVNRSSYDMVEYLIEHRCPWDENVIANAASIGNVNILKRLHEAGCPWDEKVLSAVTSWYDKKPHLECFKYALKEGAPLSPKILYNAAMYNTLPILKTAIEAGCPLPPEDLVYTAVRCGSLSCLKYLHKTNEITRKHLHATITFGHVNCLKYILEHTDLDIDDVMENELNNVKCYEYLRLRGAAGEVYQIDPVRVMNGAAVNGHKKLVKHLRESGVEWPSGLLMDVFEDGPFYMLTYMLNNGASVAHLDMRRMLLYLSSHVVDNKLIGDDHSSDNRRKLRLMGTLFGVPQQS